MSSELREIMEQLENMYGPGAEPVKSGDVGMLTYIPVDQLFPHPDNPRKEIGDVSELAESIKSKGVMQNLTVVPRAEGGYTVIIGHRRSAAARLAGLSAVPCAIVEMSEREQVATMLLENMQRVDLTAYEQAAGFQMMIDFGESVESIAEKTGFSKKTVRGRLKMAELDADTFRRVSSERQLSIGDLEKIGQIEDIEKRNELLEVCGTNNFESEYKRKLTEQQVAKAMPYVTAAVKALKARKIERSETWSGKYTSVVEKKIVDFKEGDSFVIPEKYADQKLFYCINLYSNDVSIYVEKPKEKTQSVKRSKAEIEREKAIKDAHDKLNALVSEAYDLRFNFVKGLKLTKANESAMMRGAFMALICEQQYYNSNRNKSIVYEAAGVDVKELYYVDPYFDKIVAAFGADDKKMIPNIIYVSFADFRDEGFHTTWKNDPPKHRENKRLVALYEWLTSVGYEMSDDERGMMGGTHPLFEKG